MQIVCLQVYMNIYKYMYIGGFMNSNSAATVCNSELLFFASFKIFSNYFRIEKIYFRHPLRGF